jgi:hypothetical protein
MNLDVGCWLLVVGWGRVLRPRAAAVPPKQPPAGAHSLSSRFAANNQQPATNNRLLTATLLLFLPLTALGEAIPRHAPTPSEFAMQLPLSVSGENGVVQLLLPLEIYQHSRSADLADLRVYNASGQLLPYALHRPSYRTRIETRERAGALFPIYASESVRGSASSLDLQLRTGADGSLLTISAPGASAIPSATQQRLAALIIDLGISERDEVLESLSFELPEAHRDYRARIAVERSDDLKLWDGIAHDGVDWISAADATQRLVNDRIEVPGGQGRYLKIRWVDGDPVVFAAVRARWRSASVTLDPTLEVVLDAEPGRVLGDFVYQASPAIAATAIGLDLPEANTVLPVSIGFYREPQPPQQKWLLQTRLDSTFYRLTHNGRERRSSRLHIAPMSGATWVVRPHTGGHAAPRLVLSWQPQTLVFNAQGNGFVLSVGADPTIYSRWTGGPAAMEQVAPGYSRDEIQMLERAVPGTLRPTPPLAEAMDPLASPVDAAAEAARMRRFALWSVLGVGVLLLGYMTWRLLQQVNAGDKPDL